MLNVSGPPWVYQVQKKFNEHALPVDGCLPIRENGDHLHGSITLGSSISYTAGSVCIIQLLLVFIPFLSLMT